MNPVPRLGIPRGGPRDRRPILVAIALHIVVLIAISGIFRIPMLHFLRGALRRAPDAERVTYVVQTPPPAARPPRDTAIRRPPDPARPPSDAAVAVQPPVTVPPPVTPPTEVPTGVAAPRPAGGDSVDRRIVGRGGIPGLSPGVKDPRLLGPIGRPGPDPLFTAEYLPSDSIVRSWVRTYWDSVALAQMNPGRDPRDWTFDHNGKTYGVDPTWIHFGKFKLPTMLLALLPINTQANPSIYERRRALASMRAEIEFQAMRASNDDAFMAAIKELRERKLAEYLARQKKK